MKPIFIALAALLLASPAYAVDVAAQREALRDAYAQGDGAGLQAAANALLQEYPGHPTYLFHLARAKAVLGHPEEARAVLESVVRRGVDMTQNASDDEAFDEVRALPAFGKLKGMAGRLHAATGSAGTFASFGPEDAMPEGVVVDGGQVFVSSVRRGSVLARRSDGSIEEWAIPGRWSAQGMHLADDAKTLWVATAALNVSANAADEDQGRAALVGFDVKSGKVRARHVFPGNGEHVFGDFVFLEPETVLLTDSIGGGVHALDLVTGRFTRRIPPGTLRSPQGIARIGATVFIADYGNGLYRYLPEENRLEHIDDGPASPYGIDGLHAHGNTLVAIQNGVRPQQVARFILNEDMTRIVSRKTLLANHAAFDEPTLGHVVNDTLYLVANSHWNRVNGNGELEDKGLEPPVILALPL